MTRYSSALIPLGLVLALAGCRFNANRPAVPTGSARPSAGSTAPATIPGASAPPTTVATPAPAASVSATAAIPVIAKSERDLRHLPQDMAMGPDGTVWLLADDGIWLRPATATTWTADATLKTVELPATPTKPPAELVTDPAGEPWILDPASGRLWKHTGPAQWQVAASGLTGATGLSVGADGTAYAVAATPSDAPAAVWRIRAGSLEAATSEDWQHPVTTAVDPKGELLIIDDGKRMVHRFGSDLKLAAIPTALGRLTIGRDADGSPLIIGGQKAFTAVRIGDRTLSYPTLPVTTLPMASSNAFSATRLFGTGPGQYLAMVRIPAGTTAIGEVRSVTVIGRQPGQTYAPSTSYTGTALAVRIIADREVAKLGSGYQLCRIRGTGKTQETTNRSTAWYYDYFRLEDASLVSISLAPQGLHIDRSFLPEGLTPPTALGEVPIDSHQAWAAAVKVGMPNQISADVLLQQESDGANWRIGWTSGGQSYKVHAVTGAAGLDTN